MAFEAEVTVSALLTAQVIAFPINELIKSFQQILATPGARSANVHTSKEFVC